MPNLEKLNLKQLVRQLKALGAEVDPEQKWKKEELVNAVLEVTKAGATREVEVTKELLKSELGSKLKELGFKAGETLLLPEAEASAAGAQAPATKPKEQKLSWGLNGRPVLRVEEVTGPRGEALKRVVFTDCVELHNEEELNSNLNKE